VQVRQVQSVKQNVCLSVKAKGRDGESQTGRWTEFCKSQVCLFCNAAISLLLVHTPSLGLIPKSCRDLQNFQSTDWLFSIRTLASTVRCNTTAAKITKNGREVGKTRSSGR